MYVSVILQQADPVGAVSLLPHSIGQSKSHSHARFRDGRSFRDCGHFCHQPQQLNSAASLILRKLRLREGK